MGDPWRDPVRPFTHAMINVIALTQLAFLTLGLVLVRILHRATGGPPSTAYTRMVVDHWYWLYSVPILWIAFALVSARVNRAPLSSPVARGVGFILAVLSFVFFVSAPYSTSR